MKVERFKDLICWQKARAMTNLVYELTRLPMFAKDFELARQIRAAAISSMSNIAEGFDRWSRKEFVRFPDIARGSAGEVRSQLYVALDQHYVTKQQFDTAHEATLETSKTTGGLIGYLENRNQGYTAREATASSDSALDLPSEFCNPDADLPPTHPLDSQAPRHPGTQAPRHPGTQALRHSGTQALRHLNTQALKHSGT